MQPIYYKPKKKKAKKQIAAFKNFSR